MSRDETSTARRHGILIALLPGLIVGCLYSVFLRPRLTGAIERAAADLADTTRQQPSALQVSAALDRVESLRGEVAAARSRIAGASESSVVDAGAASPESRDGDEESLIEALLRGGVTLISERPGDTRIAEMTARRTGRAPARIRELELTGTYAQMLRTIEEIAKLEAAVQILALDMKSASPNGTTWTLTVG